MTIYPLSALRTLALHAQGLSSDQNPPHVGLDEIFQVVEQVGCVQIDTLQMVQRSHYLAIWSRLGSFDPADYDRLVYDPAERRLFEGWQHCACLIPLCDYCYQMPQQRQLREQPSNWYQRWLTQNANVELVPQVLERVRQEGALRAADFASDGRRRSSWWDWKPAKVALEYLYAFGDLMISQRVNFQRVYDLTERVLPAWVDCSEPTTEQRDCFWIEQGVRALGACTPAQACDYAYRKRTPSRKHLQTLLAEGMLVEIEGEMADGGVQTLLVHRANLPALALAADGALTARRTTFLNPFDSLFWARGRDEQLWVFDQALEAYKPAAQRIYGYYCLPILHHDRLVGRFDPKLERKDSLLRIKALYLEPGVEPDEELITAVAAAMRDFMEFHRATALLVERSQPQEFGDQLIKFL